MTNPRDQQFVFASAVASDGVPFVIIGIPRASWEAMASHIGDQAWGQDADLTKMGIPVRFSLFACETNDDGRKAIEKIARDANIALDDRRRTDFSIKGKQESADGFSDQLRSMVEKSR